MYHIHSFGIKLVCLIPLRKNGDIPHTYMRGKRVIYHILVSPDLF